MQNGGAVRFRVSGKRCARSLVRSRPGIHLAVDSSGHSSGHPRRHDAVAVGMAAGASSVSISPAWFVCCPSGAWGLPSSMQGKRQGKADARQRKQEDVQQSKARVREEKQKKIV